MNDEQLRRRFHALAPTSVAAEPDRHVRVHERMRARRRRQLAAATTSLVVAGLVVGTVVLVRPGGSPAKDVTTLSTVTDAGLQLRTKVQHAPADSRLVTLDEVLTGRSTSAARYGWIVYWGDGGYDRAYGGSGCTDTAVHDVSEERVFDHRYAHAGSFRVVVQVTLCGQRQLQDTAAVRVS